MTREDAIKELKEYEDGLDLEYATPFDKAILYAIKALSQEPTFDDECQKDLDEAWKQIQKKRKRIPITQKSGKWIDREEYDADRWKCSVCGRTEQYKENYCPDCGAKMESEDKE